VSHQLAIEFDAPPRARKTDPTTSHEAARRAELFATSHAERIVCALRMRGPSTAHELEPHTRLNYVQIDRRMHELVKAGRIKRTPLTRPTPTGGRAQVWELA
jgi:hypothetical protein